jgi:hypothetical protein
MLLKNLIEQDLAGWQLRYVYSMEIEQGGMGYFPAMVAKTKQDVVCLKRDDLRKIWEILPKRHVRVNKMLLLVNLQEQIVLPIRSIIKEDESDSKDFFLVTSERLTECLLKDDFFQWSKGLVSFKDGKAVFPEEEC